MIQTNDIFIPLPKAYDTQVKIEIDGIDEKSKVLDSSWIKPATIGLGTFSVTLKNAFGQVSDKYKAGDVVKYFYDNSNATRLQFQGRIDHIEEIMSASGQALKITGRHRSFLLTETKVNFSATNADPADILKSIIAQLPSSYGFTSNNVENVGITISKEWNYVSFWTCVQELCHKSGFDCRVDNDLDFHFHKKDSKINYDEFIVDGLNHISTSDFGIDDFVKKTRVTAIGRDDIGQIILFTAKSKTEGDEIREEVVRDSSANTVEKVQVLAEGRLLEIESEVPQATFSSKGLETLEPGEDIWVIVMRQKIYGLFRAIEVTQRFGSKIGGARTKTKFEKEFIGINQLMEDRIRNESKITKADNVNKLEFSHNFDFNNDDLTESHRQTEVKDGLLVLANAGFNDGTWISDARAASKNITKVELRVVGKDLLSSIFKFSVDNINFETFSGFKTLQNPSNTGKNLKLEIKLVKDDLNPQPVVNSASILFS